MFFKHAQIYRLPSKWAFTAQQMIEALTPHTFTPASSNELLRQGWDAPRPSGELVHVVNGQWLLQLRSEKKLLPATVINQVAKARAAEMEEAQGFAPGKKAMKELKERVADELLPRAFAIQGVTNIWIDPAHGWLAVDAASPAKADEAIKLLLKAVDRMPLESLRVNRSPVGVMTEWLQADDAPAGFTVDQDALLRATGESKAQVVYKRHTLEADEVRRHIAAGKQCTRLAMTWESKISFVLDESLSIKSIKPLDVIMERDRATDRNDDDRFNGDFMLMTGELNKLLTDLVEALGGQAEGSLPAAEPVPRAAVVAPAGQRKLERAIQMTAEMYKMRETYRAVLDELYEKTLKPYVDRICEQMKATEAGAIESALAIAKEQPAGSQSTEMLLVAAIEIMEPSQPNAKDHGGAPGVNGHGLGAVPAGDGSAADPLYAQAVEVVRTNRRASISLVQRHLRIGYNRAARLLETMAAAGMVTSVSSGYELAGVQA